MARRGSFEKSAFAPAVMGMADTNRALTRGHRLLWIHANDVYRTDFAGDEQPLVLKIYADEPAWNAEDPRSREPLCAVSPAHHANAFGSSFASG